MVRRGQKRSTSLQTPITYAPTAIHPSIHPSHTHTPSPPAGLSSIFSLPISLLSSAVFSDVFWARVWSAEDKTSLKRGALCGFGLTTLVIAFFGFVGFLGQWAGLPPLDDNNNLAFFVPFTPHGRAPGAVAIRVLIVVLATTMSQSAVDSLQNAIVAGLTSGLLKGRPVAWSRALVFLVNVPIVALALQGYALLDLFLAMNVLTTAAAGPLLSGLWLPGVSGATVLLASAAGLACTCALGVAVQAERGRGAAAGLRWVFTSRENLYDYRIFVVAALTSIAATLLSWFIWDTRGRGLELLAEARLAQQARREERRATGVDGGGVDVGDAGGGGEGSGSSSRSRSDSNGDGGDSLRQPFLARCPCPLNRGPGWAWGRQQQRRRRRQQHQPTLHKLPSSSSSASGLAPARSLPPSVVVVPGGTITMEEDGDGDGEDSSRSVSRGTLSPAHSILLEDDEDEEWDGVAAAAACSMAPAAERIGGERGGAGGPELMVDVDMA